MTHAPPAAPASEFAALLARAEHLLARASQFVRDDSLLGREIATFFEEKYKAWEVESHG